MTPRSWFTLIAASILAILCLSSLSEATSIEAEAGGCKLNLVGWKTDDCTGPSDQVRIDTSPFAKACLGALRFWGKEYGSITVDCQVKQASFFSRRNCPEITAQSLHNGICTPVVLADGSKISMIVAF